VAAPAGGRRGWVRSAVSSAAHSLRLERYEAGATGEAGSDGNGTDDNPVLGEGRSLLAAVTKKITTATEQPCQGSAAADAMRVERRRDRDKAKYCTRTARGRRLEHKELRLTAEMMYRRGVDSREVGRWLGSATMTLFGQQVARVPILDWRLKAGRVEMCLTAVQPWISHPETLVRRALAPPRVSTVEHLVRVCNLPLAELIRPLRAVALVTHDYLE
jgi:hypothetical protein